MYLAIEVYRLREGKPATTATRRLFAFSIVYLFALFAILLLEVVVKAALPLIW
jgi:protoheme IX farnesyltransferase